MTLLQTIPLDKIDVGEGFNPRTSVDVDEGFLDSVRTHGVLTPILVHPQGSGDATRFFLVAGGRRVTAARELGHTDIPAVVRTEFAHGNALPAALVENLQREQLTPIEEAHAFKRAFDDGVGTLASIAQAVGVSHDLVKARVALLELPPVVQEKIGAGELTLRAAAALSAIAPLGEAVVAKVVEMIADPLDEATASDLEDDPGSVVDWALESLDLDGGGPFLVPATVNGSIALEGYNAVDWPKGSGGEAVKAKAKQLPEHDPATYKSVRRDALRIDEADLDAARAYGCLFEISAGGARRARGQSTRVWFTDPVWLADRLLEKLDKAIAAWERKQKSAAKKAAKAAGVEIGKGDDPAKALREAKRLENAEKKAATLAARERNITLGVSLFKGLHAPAITTDSMRVVAELLATYAGEDLGRAGLRYVDEASQTVTTRKDGSISSVAHVKGHGQAAELLQARLAKATTPEQIMGVLLQAITAARFADATAAPTNDRYHHLRGLDQYSPNRTLVGLVDKIADPVLPPAVVIAIEKQRSEEQREREEGLTEDISNVRKGFEVCASCGNPPKSFARGRRQANGWKPCECTDEQIGAAVLACPRCGEPDCHASCSGFEEVAVVDAEEEVAPA